MALCKNPKCRELIVDVVWGDGYCCKHCFETSDEYDPEAHDNIPHPDDRRKMHIELCRNADLNDAMMEAYAIDPRLPKIIYLRRKGKNLREVGREVGLSHVHVNSILGLLPPNTLRACGLREK